VSEASLLLVVHDASSSELEEHVRTTHDVLERLGARDVPRLVVLSKADLLPEPIDALTLSEWSEGAPALALSSRDTAAVSKLREVVLDMARSRHRIRRIFVPYERPEILSTLYARCRVLETHAAPTGTQLLVEGEPRILDEVDRRRRAWTEAPSET